MLGCNIGFMHVIRVEGLAKEAMKNRPQSVSHCLKFGAHPQEWGYIWNTYDIYGIRNQLDMIWMCLKNSENGVRRLKWQFEWENWRFSNGFGATQFSSKPISPNIQWPFIPQTNFCTNLFWFWPAKRVPYSRWTKYSKPCNTKCVEPPHSQISMLQCTCEQKWCWGGDFFRSLELLPLRLHLQLTLNFGGEGVVSDIKGLNISSICN